MLHKHNASSTAEIGEGGALSKNAAQTNAPPAKHDNSPNSCIQKIISELQKQNEVIKQEGNEDFSGSDSEPSEDEMDQDILLKILPA